MNVPDNVVLWLIATPWLIFGGACWCLMICDWLKSRKKASSKHDPPNYCLWCGKNITGKIGQFCSRVCTDAYCKPEGILCDNCAEYASDWTEYQGERLCSDCYRGRDRSDYAL